MRLRTKAGSISPKRVGLLLGWTMTTAVENRRPKTKNGKIPHHARGKGAGQLSSRNSSTMEVAGGFHLIA